MLKERGCGKRSPGGIYLVTDLSSQSGIPIDKYLFDPPWQPKDTEGNFVLPGRLGVTITEISGIAHILDWIGAQYYPEFPDFWEETRRHGLSRRVSPSTPLDQLTRYSQIIGFHLHGWLADEESRKYVMGTRVQGTGMDTCPGSYYTGDDHEDCVRLLWQLVDQRLDDTPERLHSVNLPRHSKKPNEQYMAAYVPPGIPALNWEPAAMFHLPIHRIEVIEDQVDQKHVPILMGLASMKLVHPIRLVTAEEEEEWSKDTQ